MCITQSIGESGFLQVPECKSSFYDSNWDYHKLYFEIAIMENLTQIIAIAKNINTLLDDHNADDKEDDEKEAISVRNEESKTEYDEYDVEEVLTKDKRKQLHKNKSLTETTTCYDSKGARRHLNKLVEFPPPF
ncbi:hypothetical protein FQA39_LY04536 [Lamprigera yunnana]|nr:hypothetical protein FQA39_LY04536 [Lamprigera yunnana]